MTIRGKPAGFPDRLVHESGGTDPMTGFDAIKTVSLSGMAGEGVTAHYGCVRAFPFCVGRRNGTLTIRKNWDKI